MRKCERNSKRLSKQARALRPNLLKAKWREVERENNELKAEIAQRMQNLTVDTASFFEHVLGFKPHTYQKEFIELFENNQFTAARWCRQSGKTYTISALLLKYAITHPNTAIGVVGPSWRQTKRIIARIAAFTYNLPDGMVFKPQKTTIHFANGSSIEAFPNNPDTIRGPSLHVVYADELNFVANDHELYDAVLYTLGTTDGKFVCSSTPWHTDSLFYKIFNHKNYRNFKTSHVTYQQALYPNGPLKPNIIKQIKSQMGEDPMRWQREMMADWAEDEDVWLSQSLIASCIGTNKNCNQDLKLFNPNQKCAGDFYVGLDPAQTRDYHVLSVVELVDEQLFLRHLNIFQHPTHDAFVLAYIKALQDRWGGFRKIRVDITREGPSFIADMENAGIENAEGVNFSVPRKNEMACLLKSRMNDGRFLFPMVSFEKPYRGDICNELNVERFALRADGNYSFNHPSGTHDDVFWSIALAVYATADMEPEPCLTIVPRS